MNTIGDAISYAVDGVYYLAATIKYYVRGVPPAIPDDGDYIVVVESVQDKTTDQHGVVNATVEDSIVRVDELIEPSSAETEPSSAETVPASAETVPSSAETEPSSAETVPASAETVPSSAETVPSSAETVHESTPVIEHDAPPVQPSLVARVAHSFVLEELLDTTEQTDL